MLKKIERVHLKEMDNTITISFLPYTACNYKCEYCMQNGNRTKIDFEKINLFFTNFDNMIYELKKNLNNEDQAFRISMLGGELSMIDWKPYFSKINSKLKRISFITNFSAPLKYFKDLTDFCQNKGIIIRFVVSYHPSQVSLKEFTSKILDGLEMGIRIEIFKAVLDISNYKEFGEFQNWYENNKQNFKYSKFSPNINFKAFENIDDFNSNSELKEIFQKTEQYFLSDRNKNKYDVYLDNGEYIPGVPSKILPLKYDFNKSIPKKCIINTNSMKLTIGSNGEIYDECHVKIYGNIFKNNYNFNFDKQETIECHKCGCRILNCSTTQRIVEY